MGGIERNIALNVFFYYTIVLFLFLSNLEHKIYVTSEEQLEHKNRKQFEKCDAIHSKIFSKQKKKDYDLVQIKTKTQANLFQVAYIIYGNIC